LYTHVTPILQCVGPCNLFGIVWSMFVYNALHAYHHTKGKQRAFNCEVMCNFRLYLEIGRTNVKQKVLNIYLLLM